jgi:hypothetical protein
MMIIMLVYIVLVLLGYKVRTAEPTKSGLGDLNHDRRLIARVIV